MDIIAYDPLHPNPSPSQLHHLKNQDLTSFGHLILSLACSSPFAHHDIQVAFEYLDTVYKSADEIRALVLYCLNGNMKSIDEILRMCSLRVCHELDKSHKYEFIITKIV